MQQNLYKTEKGLNNNLDELEIFFCVYSIGN